MAPKKLLSLMLSCLLWLLPTGCYMDVAKDTSTPAVTIPVTGTSGTVAAVGTAAPTATEVAVGKALVKGVAGLMALSIYVAMIAFGCDSDSAAAVALSFFAVVALDLTPTVSADDPLALAPYLAENAVKALDDPAFVLPAGKTSEQALVAVVGGLFAGLSTNSAYGLTAENQAKLLAAFAGSSVRGLSASGISDVAADVALVAGAAVGALDDAGIAPAQADAPCAALMTAVVAAIPGAGLSGAQIAETASAATRAAVAALADGGVADHALADAAVRALSKGATAGLGAAGLSADEQAAAAAKIAEGAAQGMVEAGFDTTRIDAAKASLQTDLAASLEANGVDKDDAEAAAIDAAAAFETKWKGFGQ